jgi:uncharacterized protein YdaU (DUF1376 family)
MKDPAFLFYPNDYIGGTMGMSFEEKGAYIEILMMQFNRGHMTEHMIRHTVGQLWDKLMVKFIKDESGLYYNERLEIEIDKRKNYVQSRRNNVLGTNQYTKKEPKNIGHMSNHMENRNENENKDVNTDEKPKRDKKQFVAPKIEEVKLYFKENSYTEQAAEKMFNYYSVADWKDSTGKQVKNWKQKAQSVWFKDENKIQSRKPATIHY